ncbi:MULTISPECIES: hypothetical protein [Brevibacillus]|uniref:hypothetical protein n=1 Tax=Brevibacillus TaxID=55080 RepID=UPI0030F627AC
MPTIEEVRNTLEDVREKLERLSNNTDDRRTTTPEILREFALFREDVLGEIVAELKFAEKSLLDIEAQEDE